MRFLLNQNFIDMFNVKKSWISSLGAGVFALGVLLFGAVFLYAKIRHLSVETRNARDQIYIAEKKQKEFVSADRSMAEYQTEIATLDQAFVREDTFVQFLRFLEDAARISGVSFKAANARLPLTDSEEASFSFELRSDFSGIARFFSLLDQNPYAGIVDHVFIRRPEDKSKTIQADGTYLIFNYLK